MKKHLLTFLLLALGMIVNAQTPAITAVGTVGVEREITIGLNNAGSVSIDWGDGNLIEQSSTQAYDGWDGSIVFKGTPVHEGNIKIYGDSIIYIEAVGRFNEDKSDIPNALLSIDLSKATELTEAALNTNKFENINVANNTKLKNINVANNKLENIDVTALTELATLTINDNKITELDLSKNTKLTTLMLTNNKVQTLDLSNNKVLKTMTCLNNELTSVNIGANEAKGHTFQFGGNKLKTFSLKNVVDLSTSFVYLRDNELTEVELPATVRRLWLDGNNFTPDQLYTYKSMATQTFTYATTFTKEWAQAPMAVEAKGNVVDLSKQAMLGETATAFVWKKADGEALVEGTDYTVANGVFTFTTNQTAICCEMTNAELKDYTFKTVAVNIEFDGIRVLNPAQVEDGNWYNLQGIRVENPSKGLYIKNGKIYLVK